MEIAKGILCVIVFVSLVECSVIKPLATLPAISSCRYNGKDYPIGSFKPTPCEHCQCTSNGQALCAIADCFITPCVNSVRDPKKCCPVCPDGPNCRASDGTIIKLGETYNPDKNTACTCNGHGFSHEAVCAVRIVDPVPIESHVVS